MDKRKFHALPLTPVHVGTGESLAPEDYFLESGALVRFNSHGVIGGLSPGERASLEGMLDQGRLREGILKLREHARRHPEAHMYRVAVGPGSLRYLETVVSRLETRRGDVRPLMRNLYTGRAVIPGSAIKGAMRTAVVSAVVENLLSEPRDRDRWLGRVKAAEAGEMSRLWRELEKEVGIPDREPEKGPFRFLSVRDAEVEASLVQVDRAQVVQREGDPARTAGIEMHYERLLSEADGQGAPVFEVEAALDERQDDRRLEGLDLKFALNWDYLAAACNRFFGHRFAEEKNGFGRCYEAVNGEIADRMPAGGILLRIGRFSHFESLSVEGLRRGEDRQRNPIWRMGKSRTVCEVRGNRMAPFGWVLLTPAGGAPARGRGKR